MINLTIQSLNNKTVSITNFDNFNKVYSNISNNLSIPLDYNNYLVEIGTKTSSLSLDNFWNNLSSITKDGIFLIISIIIIFTVIMVTKYFKKL